MARHSLQSVKQLLPAHGEEAVYGDLKPNDEGGVVEEVTARVAVVCWAWIEKPGRAEVVALVPEDNRPMLCRADDWTNYLRIES